MEKLSRTFGFFPDKETRKEPNNGTSKAHTNLLVVTISPVAALTVSMIIPNAIL
jgi:hypothetical protein